MLKSKHRIKGSIGILARIAAGIALSASFGHIALCQQPTPPPKPVPPPGALLNPAPAFSTWTINFSYPQDGAQEAGAAKPAPLDPGAVRKVVVVKTGDIIHEETTMVSGATLDKWQTGGTFYVKPPGQTYWGACGEGFVKKNPTMDAKLLPLPASGFRGLEWINDNAYAGSIKQNGMEYLLFVSPGSADMDFSTPAKLASQDMVAYVDATTRLPIAVRSHDVTESYSFGHSPGSMQMLPPALAKQIQDESVREAKLFAAPNRE